MTRTRLAASTLCAVLLSLVAGSLSATQIGATHLVFEKKTKMKRVAPSLYMSFLDQSAKNDQPGNPRHLRCAVTALGPSGPVPAKGEFVVRLLGRKTASSWQSSELAGSIDQRGVAEFDGGALLELVGEANADGAELELFRIEFDGGKGKKLTQITVDCLLARVGVVIYEAPIE